MFTNWVICIFSYNRGGFLKNLLESITAYYPEMNIAVFDDGSDEEYTLKVLSEVSANGGYVYARSDNDMSSKHGGLYPMMNQALDYVKKSTYQYAYFVQDDMQFLWRDNELEERVRKVFSRNECVMCNANFLQKITINEIADKLPKASIDNLYAFKNNGVADTGVIDIAKAKKVNLSFPENGEINNGGYWHDRGLQLYWLPQPHLAWVPWPKTYRHKLVEQRRVNTLHPIRGRALERLLVNKDYAYLEDYTKTVRWYPKPYWYAASLGKKNMLKVYLKYYLRQIFK